MLESDGLEPVDADVHVRRVVTARQLQLLAARRPCAETNGFIDSK
jgi:hypothetical protein